MMTTESPYERVRFDGLLLMANPGQQQEIAQALRDADCDGRWHEHRGGVLPYREGRDPRRDDRVKLWSFSASSPEDAARGQLKLDTIP